MPVLQVDVQTRIGEVYVSNVYHVMADDFNDAQTQGINICINQAAMMPNTWQIDYIRISTPTPGDKSFRTVPINQNGGRSGGGETMPLFCRWRIDMQVGDRRPLRKFLVGIMEGDQSGGQLTNAAIIFAQTSFINPMIGDPNLHLCAIDGTEVISMAVKTQVGMHQLRRASKRKTPVI